MEPRLLYSADPFGLGALPTSVVGAAEVRLWQPEQERAVAAQPLDAPGTAQTQVQPRSQPQPQPQPQLQLQLQLQLLAASDAATQRVEWVFIDQRVTDLQPLLDALASSAQARQVHYEWALIDSHSDGLKQIGQALAGQTGISAIHIVSHGDEGVLLLGNTTVTEATLARQSASLSLWATALTADADILLWGCEVGAGEQGQALVQRLAAITGADVAASTNLTGATALGGDWVLEARSGRIEASALLGMDVQGSWLQTLALTPAGSETRVNTSTSNTQDLTLIGGGGVAMDSSGNYVVVWNDANNNSGDIYFQRYNTAGVAQGSNLRVNTTTANQQSQAQVAMDANGNFVVTWTSILQDGSGEGVYARRYNASGVAQGGEFRVNTTTANDQGVPTIAMASSTGDFVISWADSAADGSGYGVYAQRYNASGVAQGGEFRVNTSTASVQSYSSAAMDADGNFVIAWESNHSGNYEVYAQRYNASGAAQGDEFRVNTTTTSGVQWNAAAAMDASGNFVVTWEDQSGADGSAYGIYAQRYNTAGLAQGSEFRVNTTTINQQSTPAVAMSADGQFIVSWQSTNQDGSGTGVYAQQFNSSGTALNTETQVATTSTNNQQQASVGYQGGNAVVAWSGNGTGDTAGVFMQRYTDSGGVPAAVANTTTGTATNQLSVTVSHTTSGINRLMLVGVTTDPHGESVSSVTYNGVNLVLVAAVEASGAHSRAELWSLLAPATGTHNLVVNLTGTGYNGVTVGVTTFTGVNQTTPLPQIASASGSGTTASTTANSATNELVFGVVHAHNGSAITPGAGQTELWDIVSDQSNGSATTEPGAASVTTSYTVNNADWSVVAVAIKAAPNAAPVITNLAGDSLAYTEGAGVVVIEQGGDATVSDADSTDFNTGTLTVSFAVGSDSAEDVLAIRDQGSGAGQIGVSGANVSYSGLTIGSTTGGSSGSNLVITLNSSATPTAVTALVRNITYQNIDTNAPTTGARTVRYVLTDGDGGTSANRDTTVTVSAVNDAPTASNLGAAQSYTEDTVLALTPIVVSDADNANTTVTLTLSDPAAGSLNTGTSGAVISTYNAGTGEWTASGAIANVNALLAALSFTPTLNCNASISISASVSDGVAAPVTGSKALGGTAVNDAPVLSGTNDLYTINRNPVVNEGALVLDLIAGHVADPDDSAVSGIAVTAVDNTNGAWQYSVNSGSTWTAFGAPTTSTARVLLADASTRVRFVPTANWSGTVAAGLSFHAWDSTSGSAGATANASPNGGATAFSAAAATASIVVNAANNAPVLAGANSLNAVNEDATGQAGTLVSVLIAGQTSDADPGAAAGIAVMAVDNSNGSWEFTINAGSTWTAFGTPSGAAARLLASDANTSVRFVPAANWNGTVNNGISFRAWDRTSGNNGGVAAVSGGTENVLDRFNAVSYSGNEGSVNWSSSWTESDSGGGGAGGGDIDVTSGYVRIKPVSVGNWLMRQADLSSASAATFTFDMIYNVLNAGGQVQVQVSGNGGSSFTALTTITNANSTGPFSFDISAYVAANTQIRFYALGASSNGIRVDNVSIQYSTTAGGATAFSSAAASALQGVNAVNDAPLRSAGSVNNLTVAEGAPATTLGLAALAYAPGGGADEAAQMLSYTVTAVPTPAMGIITLSDGTTVVSANTAYSLAQLRGMVFVAAPNAHGGPTTFSWTVTDSGGTLNGGVNIATESLTVAVMPVNDAPLLNPAQSPALQAVAEEGGEPAGAVGTLVSSLVDFNAPAGQVDNVSDVDGGALLGVAVTGASGNGALWYSVDGGTTWLGVGSVSTSSARLLAADATTRIYFQPHAGYSGTIADAITFQAWDRSSGGNGSLADASVSGGNSAFSAASDVTSLVVAAVNDVPRLTGVELISNGGFDSGLVGWATAGMVTHGSNAARFGEFDSVGPHRVAQTFATTAGQAYRLSFDYRDDQSAWDQTLRVSVNGASTLLDSGSIISSLQGTAFVAYTYSFVADSTLTTITFTDASDTAGVSRNTVSVDGRLDNVSVRADSAQLGSAAFTEGAAPVLLDADVSTFDLELSGADNFAGSTLTWLRNGGASSEDLFSATGLLSSLVPGGALVYNGTTIGTVTANSAGTLAWAFNAAATQSLVDGAMRAVGYTNANEAPAASVRIDWRFDDGNTGAQGSGGALATSGYTMVSITAVNDAAVLTPTVSSLPYLENQTALAVDPALTVSDIDSANLASATVNISANYASDQDVMAFSNQNGISGSWNAGTGVLTLTGSATVANYQTALRSITYLNTSDNPSTLTRTVSFTVSDGSANSNTVARDIGLVALNDAPMLALDLSGSFITAFVEDGGPVALTDANARLFDLDNSHLASLTVTLINRLDGAAETLVFSTVGTAVTGNYDTASGVLTLSGSDTVAHYQQVLRTISYDNSSQAPTALTRNISFVASDGISASNLASATVGVSAVNDAPVLDNLGTLTLAALTEDQTANSGHSVAEILASAGGQRISDADAPANTAAAQGIAIIGTVDGNGAWQYSMDAGANWLAVGTTSEASALLLRDTDRLRFVPDGNNPTQAQFSFRAWDRSSGNAGGRVDTQNNGGATAFSSLSEVADVAVSSVNDAPTGLPVITGTAREDLTLTAQTAGVADVDGLGAFSYQWQRNGVDITGATLASYLLGDADVSAQIRVQLSYTDAQGTAQSLSSAPTQPVANVNDLPQGLPLVLGMAQEGQWLTLDISDITDRDGLGNVSVQWLRDDVPIAGANGARWLLDDADLGRFISVRVSYTDGWGTLETLESSGLGPVAGINDAPRFIPADPSAPLALTVAENARDITTLVANDDDAPIGSLRFSISGGTDAARFEVDGLTGALRLVLAQDYEAPADTNSDNVYELTVAVQDGLGARAEQAFRIRVTDVNEAPALQAPTELVLRADIQSDAQIAQATGRDVDTGDALSYALLENGGGAFGIDSRTGSITVVHPQWLNFAQQSAFDLVVQVTDAGGLSERRFMRVVLLPVLAPSQSMTPVTPAAPATPVGPEQGSPSAAATPSPLPSNAAGPEALPAPGSAAAPAQGASPSDPTPSTSSAALGSTRGVANGLGALLRDASAGETVADALPAVQSFAVPSSKVQEQNGFLWRTAAGSELSVVRDVVINLELARSALTSAMLSAEGLGAEASQSVSAWLGRAWAAGTRGRDAAADGERTDDVLAASTQISQPPPAEKLLLELTQPERVLSVSLTAGLVWWFTRGGGFLATALMGVPVWRQVDLLPVLAEGGAGDDDDYDNDENGASRVDADDSADAAAEHGAADDAEALFDKQRYRPAPRAPIPVA